MASCKCCLTFQNLWHVIMYFTSYYLRSPIWKKITWSNVIQQIKMCGVKIPIFPILWYCKFLFSSHINTLPYNLTPCLCQFVSRSESFTHARYKRDNGDSWFVRCTSLCRKTHCRMDSLCFFKNVDIHFVEIVSCCHSLMLTHFNHFNRWHDLVLRRVSIWKCYISPFQCKTLKFLNLVTLTFCPSINCPSVKSLSTKCLSTMSRRPWFVPIGLLCEKYDQLDISSSLFFWTTTQPLIALIWSFGSDRSDKGVVQKNGKFSKALWIGALCKHGNTLNGSHMDWEMEKLFPVKEKSENFEQTGKVRKFCPKYWKN